MAAEAGRRANKGQNKGRVWAMIMQLGADPTHEYGKCGGDSHDQCELVCAMHAYTVSYRTLFACAPVSFDP